LLVIFRQFVGLPTKINRCWTTFETLAEIERVAKNDNSSLHWRLVKGVTSESFYICGGDDVRNVVNKRFWI